MSRVRWRSLLARTNFEFSHNAAGRLMDTEPTATRAWAAAGSGTFLKWAVPALQAAGKNVVALSVLTPSQHSIGARLAAQDEQDRLCHSLRVPLGLSPEKLGRGDDCSVILCDDEVPSWVAALATDSESFVEWLPISSLPSANFSAQTGGFARPDVVYQQTNKRQRPAGW